LLHPPDSDSVEDYLNGLRRHYPNVPDGAEINVVNFVVR
jgi:hypothetical protein